MRIVVCRTMESMRSWTFTMRFPCGKDAILPLLGGGAAKTPPGGERRQEPLKTGVVRSLLVDLALVRREARRKRRPGLRRDAERMRLEEIPGRPCEATAAAVTTASVTIDDEAAVHLESGVRDGAALREVDDDDVLALHPMHGHERRRVRVLEGGRLHPAPGVRRGGRDVRRAESRHRCREQAAGATAHGEDLPRVDVVIAHRA